MKSTALFATPATSFTTRMLGGNGRFASVPSSNRIELQAFAVVRPIARCREHQAHQIRRPPARRYDAIEENHRLMAGRKNFLGEGGAAEDRGEQVIEVVRQPAGQHPEAFPMPDFL